MKRLIVLALALILVQLGCNMSGSQRNVGGNTAIGDPVLCQVGHSERYGRSVLPFDSYLVGRFEEDVHRANLTDDNWAYFIGLDAQGVPQGFAILQNCNTRDGNEFLRRIAVAHAGGGFGKPFLSALVEWVFTQTDANRFYLHVRNGNSRARHVYTSLGFIVEGPEDGDPGSVTMGLTRAAWSER